MKLFEVALSDLFRVTDNDQARIVQRLTSLFATNLGDCRLITVVAPMSFDKLVRKRRQLATERSMTWERQGLLEEADMIEQFGRSGMQRARHYLIDFDGKMTAMQLAQWRIVAKEVEKIPLLPKGKYSEQPTHMQPVTEDGQIDHSRPLYHLMQSSHFKGRWTVSSPLVDTIVEADFPLILMVDIRKVSPTKLDESATQWGSLARNSEQPERMAVQAEAEAEFALTQRDQRVHHVLLMVMVMAQREKDLHDRSDQIAAALSSSMGVDRLRGYQAMAAAYYTPVKKPALTPKGHYNTMSAGAALCASVWGIGRKQATDGFLVGASIDSVAAHLVYLQWEGNDPFHGLILGQTGKGKTVAMGALAGRAAEQGVQVIMMEPQGHSVRLKDMGGELANYQRLAYGETQYNPLEIFYVEKSEQYDHVTMVFELLLKRQFDNFERAAIRIGLEQIYSHFTIEELMTQPEITPTLTHYCQRLNQMSEDAEGALQDAMQTVAAELKALFVKSDFATTFNAPTNIDLSLSNRINLFDFSAVPKDWRGLFYYLTVSNLIRRIRSEGFKKRMLFIDEVYYMSREPALMQALAEMTKTVRSYGTAVVLADQDLETYLGVEDASGQSMNAGLDVASGVYIINNTQWVLSFGLKNSGAERLAAQYPSAILPTHVDFLSEMGSREDDGVKGMSVLIYRNRADMVYVQLRPREAAHLLGS